MVPTTSCFRSGDDVKIVEVTPKQCIAYGGGGSQVALVLRGATQEKQPYKSDVY